MPRNILETIDRLPPQVNRMLDNAIWLANDEMQLQVVDTSVVLLAIVRLGDGDPSARWLHSIGITDDVAIRQIKKDFSSRGQATQGKGAWGGVRPLQDILTFTSAVTQMVNRLDRAVYNGRVTNAAQVAKVLDAIAHSDSRTVQQIFATVRLEMSDVRIKLETPTILDLEKHFASRH